MKTIAIGLDIAKPVFQKLLDRGNLRPIAVLGHGLLPRQRVGDFDHHLHSMATSDDFAELSACYPKKLLPKRGRLYKADEPMLLESAGYPPSGS